MDRRASGHRLVLLRLSALGFVGLTGILAFGYFLLFRVLGPSTDPIPYLILRISALSFILPALPGAVLSWWLLVVSPRRSSARAGGCAGLLTIVFAVLGFCVTELANGGFSAAPLAPWQVVQESVIFWPWGLVYVCLTPAGWVLLLLGAIAGALYGTFVSSSLSETPGGTAAPGADLHP